MRLHHAVFGSRKKGPDRNKQESEPRLRLVLCAIKSNQFIFISHRFTASFLAALFASVRCGCSILLHVPDEPRAGSESAADEEEEEEDGRVQESLEEQLLQR